MKIIATTGMGLLLLGLAACGTSTTTTVLGSGGDECQDGFLVICLPPPIVIGTESLPNAALNVAYSQSIVVSCNTCGDNYTWSVKAGSLPTGLSLTGVTSEGLIEGTPTELGTFNFTVRVVSGDLSAEQALSITVVGILEVTTDALPDGVGNVDYGTETLTATGGDGSYVWRLATGSGPLPVGLNLTGNGDITGTPTVVGTSNFTVTVTSGGQTASRALSITVTAP